MEALHNTTPKELAGHKILRLMTVTPDMDESTIGTRMTKDEVMDRLIFGDGLAVEDQLTVNGRDVLEELPRPDQFGNNRLALLAILDTMPPASEMTLEIDNKHTQVAAD